MQSGEGNPASSKHAHLPVRNFPEVPMTCSQANSAVLMGMNNTYQSESYIYDPMTYSQAKTTRDRTFSHLPVRDFQTKSQ